jgi:hypothetical protein
MATTKRSRRTYWQRFSLSGYSAPKGETRIAVDYMGNAEYEFGSFPRALKAIRALTQVTRVTTPPPAEFDYYASTHDGEVPLVRPTQWTWIGDGEAIAQAIESLTGTVQDNKAGLIRGGRLSATILWMPVDPQNGPGPGFIVLNDSWIDETGNREYVEEYVQSYFGIEPLVA